MNRPQLHSKWLDLSDKHLIVLLAAFLIGTLNGILLSLQYIRFLSSCQ